MANQEQEENQQDVEVESLLEPERHGNEYFSLANNAGAKGNPMAIDEENSLRASAADYNHAFNIMNQMEAPQLTITTETFTKPVPSQ